MGRWLFLGPLASARRHSTLQHRINSPRGETHHGQRTIAFNVMSSTRTKEVNVLYAYRERRRRSTTSTSDSISSSTPTSSSINDDYTQQLIAHEQSARTKRHGQAKARLEKATRRENRIYHLENSIEPNALSDAERAELEGLLKARENFEEQYSANGFSEEHIEFKRLHNEAFVALARFCQRERKRKRKMSHSTGDVRDGGDGDDDTYYEETDPNVFYLDGPDAATSTVLIENHGFDPSCCYVANRHMSTYEILRRHLPKENVLHATAAEALTPTDESCTRDNYSGDDSTVGSFSNIDFSAYYFDGCGGFTPHVIGMMTAALVRPQQTISSTEQSSAIHNPGTTAVGYSLMGGNKDVVEKELHISRALTAVARTRGMRTRHVLDDPAKFGLPPEICKTEGGTFTSWMLLEEDI